MAWIVSRLLGRGAVPRRASVTRFAPRLEFLTDRTVPSVSPIAEVGEFAVPPPIGEEIPSDQGVGYESMTARSIGEELPEVR
jgi:hypothetical protein